jgi:cytochrome c oxidase subunit I+III
MTARASLDVSHLPDHAFGSRDPMWWGVMLLMAIEGTLMVLALTTYFYVRGNYDAWPPSGVGPVARAYATGVLAVIVASGLAIVPVMNAARRHDLDGMRRWMVAATLLSLVALALRAFELHALPFRWTTGAYGSVVWTTIGFHTLHVVAGVIENGVLTVLSFTGSVENKHYVDFDLNALFWLFVVAEWVVTYAVIYGEGLVGG